MLQGGCRPLDMPFITAVDGRVEDVFVGGVWGNGECINTGLADRRLDRVQSRCLRHLRYCVYTQGC